MGTVKRTVFLFLGIVLLVLSLIPVARPEAAVVEYDIYGAFTEQGLRDGAVNCTLFRYDNSSETFEVDGWDNRTYTQDQISLTVWLENNYTRTIYFLPDDTNETIYIFRPPEPYYTYYFSVADFLGVDDGFLESLLNINGTDLVVERWSLSRLNRLPFTMNWGTNYRMRLRCSLGTYYYPAFTAAAEQDNFLSINADMFPETPSDISQITVEATRENSTWISVVYADASERTNWIYMAVYEYGSSTVLDSTNVTDFSLTWNWYDGDPKVSYYVYVEVDHDVRGTLTWTFMLPTESAYENPWTSLDTLLGGWVINPSQLIGVGIVLITFAAFSNANMNVGLVVGWITAAILVYLGWLSIAWSWMLVSGVVIMLVVLSISKEKENPY